VRTAAEAVALAALGVDHVGVLVGPGAFPRELAPAAARAIFEALPAGVVRVDGIFERGDAVLIRGPDGTEIGRGLCAYDAPDAQKIIGRASADIASILGFSGRAEMVHRDNLVISRH